MSDLENIKVHKWPGCDLEEWAITVRMCVCQELHSWKDIFKWQQPMAACQKRKEEPQDCRIDTMYRKIDCEITGKLNRKPKEEETTVTVTGDHWAGQHKKTDLHLQIKWRSKTSLKSNSRLRSSVLLSSLVEGFKCASQHHWWMWFGVVRGVLGCTCSHIQQWCHGVPIHPQNLNHRRQTKHDFQLVFSCFKMSYGVKAGICKLPLRVDILYVLLLMVNKMYNVEFGFSQYFFLKTSNVFLLSFGVESQFSHKIIYYLKAWR